MFVNVPTLRNVRRLMFPVIFCCEKHSSCTYYAVHGIQPHNFGKDFIYMREQFTSGQGKTSRKYCTEGAATSHEN